MSNGEHLDRFDRLLLSLIALIPSGIGILAFLNNLSGWNETVVRMVHPMLSMERTFGNPWQTWRAVDSVLFANAAYLFVFAIEGLFGILALLGTIRMLRSVSGPYTQFEDGIRTVRKACMIAVFIYGFVFFTIGGDWFLAWQNPELAGLQRDAVNYGIVVMLAYILLDSNMRRQ